MSIQELTLDQIESLVGTRNIVTGIEYPENGMQPYYEWLVRTLHLLSQAASSGAALKVNQDDSGSTVVIVAPGTAVLGGTVMNYAGGTLDLAFYNNDVAHVWLYDDSGSAAIGVAGSVGGWPETPHLKLAEVTLSAGNIISILDHRTDLTLTDLNPVNMSGTSAPGFLVNDQSDLARLQLDTNAAAGDFVLALSPSDLTANRRWTFPDATDTVVGVATAQTLTNKTLTSATIDDGVITGAVVTGLASPSASSDAASKGYVDSVISAGTGITVSGTTVSINTSWPGQTSIVTVGTIITGTWHGTPIAASFIGDLSATYASLSGAAFTGAISAPNLSGTNTGDQTITLTGDATGTGTGSFAVTLANSGVSAASYGAADAVPVLTIDAKGRVTSATTAAMGSIATHGEDDYLPITGGTLTGGLTLGGDLIVGFNSFAAADDSPLISFVDDGFGTHQVVLNVNTVVQGRSFTDEEEIPYLTFDGGGAPDNPLIIQNNGEGVPVLGSNGSLVISAGTGLHLKTVSGEISHDSACYFGNYLRLSAVDGALVYAQDVPFKDNPDDQNTFLLFNSSDLSLYVGTANGPVVLGGNSFSAFGVAPVGMQPCGVEVTSLTDDSGGTADGDGIVAAIGAGAMDSSAASQSDVQNAFATVIALINQLTIQVNKQRSLLLAFGWGFDETP